MEEKEETTELITDYGGTCVVRKTRLIDRAGQRYGHLTVVKYDGHRNGRAYWLCQCDCGNQKVIAARDFASGTTKSCGCMQHAHGLRKYGDAEYRNPSLYRTWNTMKQRCENPNREKYSIYGGRGIKVCDEWQDPNAFIDWSLSNGYEKGLQIDRIDNNGNYSPTNCRWVTGKENCRNRRSNVILTIDGVSKTVIEWCEETGLKHFTVYYWVRTKGKSYAEQRVCERLRSQREPN